MSNNILRSKLYFCTFDNRISTGARLFYIYCLCCIESHDLLDPDTIKFDSDYLCDLFNCSLKTLYNWINELVFCNLIQFKDRIIYICW